MPCHKEKAKWVRSPKCSRIKGTNRLVLPTRALWYLQGSFIEYDSYFGTPSVNLAAAATLMSCHLEFWPHIRKIFCDVPPKSFWMINICGTPRQRKREPRLSTIQSTPYFSCGWSVPPLYGAILWNLSPPYATRRSWSVTPLLLVRAGFDSLIRLRF